MSVNQIRVNAETNEETSRTCLTIWELSTTTIGITLL